MNEAHQSPDSPILPAGFHNEPCKDQPPTPSQSSTRRTAVDLFLISFLLLFLELAAIRWFSAQVLFLTFFINIVLLACFLGMSLGCMVSRSKRNFLLWTPFLLMISLAAALGIERTRQHYERFVDVGGQASPQMVFFGTEYHVQDIARFPIPMGFVAGFFYLLLAVTFIGLGQEIGRALNLIPDPIFGYSVNIIGSCVGILVFFGISFWELPPFWWFVPVVLGLFYFVFFRIPGISCRSRYFALVPLPVIVFLVSLNASTFDKDGHPSETYWSPYYRIDFEKTQVRRIFVNQIIHQQLVSNNDQFSPAYAYSLPHSFRRDAGSPAFEDVLIIGSGSGNDISRALHWGAKRIDAVEIDPVIQRIGENHHPDRPYQDKRVTVHLDDGRNFLRSMDNKTYDLIVYALVDSLVLHSGHSNIRLESYLFTREAFDDVRRRLKPGGWFVMYNYYRQDWIVARIDKGLTESFGAAPLVFSFPYRKMIEPDNSFQGFTLFVAGDTELLLNAFAKNSAYWVPKDRPQNITDPNGFRDKPDQLNSWLHFSPAKLSYSQSLVSATDSWPFLYLREPMIPDLSLQGIAIMGGIAMVLFVLFWPRGAISPVRHSSQGVMFFLGAGFMLIETKSVVHMALLFGSTWIVNAFVFMAILLMILAANLFVLRLKPKLLWPYFFGLFLTLGINVLLAPEFFLGMHRVLQIAGVGLSIFSPVFFAGVLFASMFGRTLAPDHAFGANIAGAMVGGLAEYTSMLMGFQYLMLVAIAFFVLATVFWVNTNSADHPAPDGAPAG